MTSLPILARLGPNRYRLANTEFIIAPQAEESTPTRFYLQKSSEMLAAYRHLQAPLRFARVLQVTTKDCGAAALIMLVGAPSRLAVVSTSTPEPTALVEFARRRGWEEALAVYSGIAADERDRLQDVAHREFPDRGLDIVLDEGSTWLEPGAALFGALFPALRPGGRYIIERWAAIHRMFETLVQNAEWSETDVAVVMERTLEDGRPIEVMLPQLVRAARRRPDVVASVEANGFWIEVVRGAADLDDSFQLSDLSPR